jgi:hypothetical protein
MIHQGTIDEIIPRSTYDKVRRREGAEKDEVTANTMQFLKTAI